MSEWHNPLQIKLRQQISQKNAYAFLNDTYFDWQTNMVMKLPLPLFWCLYPPDTPSISPPWQE